ncbi:hypothetical protein EJ03DRAFT_31807 [Teratosphaeria nubilosa]|uniref:Secreted protein n=1 Tax=Teratosphaeria nubilosa TaxID=161662 RepID=A0A6G1LHE7_9PEZI|nr:hypothetical protein EJ03DRAFT_31807 [Teratosphaeria nubilosa]
MTQEMHMAFCLIIMVFRAAIPRPDSDGLKPPASPSMHILIALKSALNYQTNKQQTPHISCDSDRDRGSVTWSTGPEGRLSNLGWAYKRAAITDQIVPRPIYRRSIPDKNIDRARVANLAMST